GDGSWGRGGCVMAAVLRAGVLGLRSVVGRSVAGGAVDRGGVGTAIEEFTAAIGAGVVGWRYWG
ncbi:MAG: hypothetical protein KAI47_04040, partial [Deltaproteobacteria bacterium]|nr:hypothetical protein [Deltaproteobacteria bacterium]